jgi:hypothetical protein
VFVLLSHSHGVLMLHTVSRYRVDAGWQYGTEHAECTEQLPSRGWAGGAGTPFVLHVTVPGVCNFLVLRDTDVAEDRSVLLKERAAGIMHV